MRVVPKEPHEPSSRHRRAGPDCCFTDPAQKHTFAACSSRHRSRDAPFDFSKCSNSMSRWLQPLPEAIALYRVPWQLLAHLTFRSMKLPDWKRYSILLAWLRDLAKGRVYFPKLLWCCRLENGKSGEHWHFHVLVGGLGPLAPQFCRLAEARWTAQGGGHSQDFSRSLHTRWSGLRSEAASRLWALAKHSG